MSASSPETARRFAGALVLTVLAIAGLGALGLAAPSPAAALEACQDCESCLDGRCDESSPFGPGDHCCLSSCLGHSGWVFSAPGVEAPVRRLESSVKHASPAPLQAEPRAVFQPPRG